MYVVFNYKTGQLQFGFKLLSETGMQNGIIFSDCSNYKNENFIILNNNYIHNDRLPDYRINIKSKCTKKIIYILLVFFVKLWRYRCRIEKFFLMFFLIIIFINVFSVGYFAYKKAPKNLANYNWNYTDFVGYFKKSRIANYIAQNKYEYVSLEIPNIKGILEYRVLPLNNQFKQSADFRAQIAVPYKSLISLSSGKSFIMKFPNYFCKNLYFYEINQDDDLLIFKNENFIGNNYYFTLFKDITMQKNICNQLENEKYELEE